MKSSRVAVIGSGPSGLMTATVIAREGHQVDIFDKNSGIGRKLLIAGSSGLNIGNNLSINDFVSCIEHDNSPELWYSHFEQFFTTEWLKFLEDIGIKTFLGTSNRYFTHDMHSASLLSHWKKMLSDRRVNFFLNTKFQNLSSTNMNTFEIQFLENDSAAIYGPYDAVSLNLGGGSWEPDAVTWPSVLKRLGFSFEDFTSANAGYHIKGWSDKLLKEILRKPIKDCVLSTSKGNKRGDLLVTEYGLEGTPIYTVGVTGEAHVDFLPDRSIQEITDELLKIGAKENFSFIRRVKKIPGISPEVHSLFYHLVPHLNLITISDGAQLLKKFPMTLEQPRPLVEAISSRGGIALMDINNNFMSKKIPGLYLTGEMLNWSAPTGGFLIQTCVTQGYIAGLDILKRLNA